MHWNPLKLLQKYYIYCGRKHVHLSLARRLAAGKKQGGQATGRLAGLEGQGGQGGQGKRGGRGEREQRREFGHALESIKIIAKLVHLLCRTQRTSGARCQLRS